MLTHISWPIDPKLKVASQIWPAISRQISQPDDDHQQTAWQPIVPEDASKTTTEDRRSGNISKFYLCVPIHCRFSYLPILSLVRDHRNVDMGLQIKVDVPSQLEILGGTSPSLRFR